MDGGTAQAALGGADCGVCRVGVNERSEDREEWRTMLSAKAVGPCVWWCCVRRVAGCVGDVGR